MAKNTKKARALPVAEPSAPAGNLTHDASTNNPPAIIEWAEQIDALYDEATNWLDGEPIATEGQASQVTKLIALLEGTMKEAGVVCEAEKKPLHEAWKAKIAEWKPVLEKGEKAVRAAKRALTPWLEAKDAEQRRIAAEKAAEAAAAAERLREQAIAARTSSDLRDEDVRESLEEEAKAAEKAAKAAARERPVTRGEGRTVGLRDVWLVNVTEPRALLQYYLKERPDIRDDLKNWLHAQAQKDVRGGARTLPGCSIWSEKKAV